jgi:alpha-L-rhamnosidase
MLRKNYEGMKGYIKYMLTWTNDEGIMFSQAPEKGRSNQWINLGDWVAPGKLPPDEMVHTFFLWRCSDLTARAARALGRTEDYKYYNDLADKVKRAFQQKYYDKEKGTYGPYGGNIFALKMGVPDDQKKRVLTALESDIHSASDHLDTGIFGTQFFFEVLSENGLHELAYKVMNQRTQPGYGWWIYQGATTTWEQWDGSNSRNHPMFGGGIVWFYRKLAGINADPDQPGYRNIIFKPQVVNEITFASYSNLTPYGTASINWKKESGKFVMDIKVPVSCTATVYVPAGKYGDIKENNKKIKQSKGISYLGKEEGYFIYKTVSGNYLFESAL